MNNGHIRGRYQILPFVGRLPTKPHPSILRLTLSGDVAFGSNFIQTHQPKMEQNRLNNRLMEFLGAAGEQTVKIFQLS